MLRNLTDRIRSRRDTIVLWGGLFVLFAAMGSVLGAKPQETNLVGGISSIVTGGINNEKDTVAAIEMTILNTGSTQSVVKTWKVEAEINSKKYEATVASMPDTFAFDFSDKTPSSEQNILTYHKEDLLVTKAMQPIQQGAVTPGVLFVIFEGISPEVFKAGGVNFSVTFEDAYSKKYSVAAQSTAKRGDRIGTLPGLHTEMVCRAPPSVLPQQTLPGSLPALPLPQSRPPG